MAVKADRIAQWSPIQAATTPSDIVDHNKETLNRFALESFQIMYGEWASLKGGGYGSGVAHKQTRAQWDRGDGSMAAANFVVVTSKCQQASH
ncbi:hypothetical protein J6590_034169 [Homalodisca vitripennis]|nr:hypothetical protein J6590_034169 [Homalodisca vitripennis]